MKKNITNKEIKRLAKIHDAAIFALLPYVIDKSRKDVEAQKTLDLWNKIRKIHR